EAYVLELGTNGRMIRLQLVELIRGVAEARELLIRDYLRTDTEWSVDDALSVLSNLETDRLVDLEAVAAALHLGSDVDDLDTPLAPRGYRMLSQIRRFPRPLASRVVDQFGLLSKLLEADAEDLAEVEGMGALRSRSV